MAAAVAAGPWPSLPLVSLAWRGSVAFALLYVVWRYLEKGRLVVVAVVVAALAADGLVPRAVDGEAMAARVSMAVRRVQEGLGGAAASAELRDVLVAGGTEAEPDLLFAVLDRVQRDRNLPLDSLVLVDERGVPVAWRGSRPRLPLRLRTLGDRSVVSEPGFGEVNIWWREPILEAGRPRGSLIGGVAVPEEGGTTVLGVYAGRSARFVPRLAGGVAISGPSGGRLVGCEVLADRATAWSLSGAALLGVGLTLLVVSVVALPIAAAASLPALFLAGPWLSTGWLLVVVTVVMAWLPGRLDRPTARRLVGTVLAVASVVLLSISVARLGVPTLPSRLLWPGPVALALLWALTVLLRRAAEVQPARLPMAAVAWLVAAAGLWRADEVLLGVGIAAVAMWGFPRLRIVLPALAAAVSLATIDAAATRRHLIAVTENTLQRIEGVVKPAEALLESLPESALAELERLSPREELVVLGRLASWLGFEEVLPGCTLAVMDDSGETVSAWGEVVQGREPVRELASRELPGGGRLAILRPPSPHDVLSAVAGSLAGGPVAVFRRSGSPVGRGATFRPLSPVRVGQALAQGRSWGRVRVGERELPAYLRSLGEVVVVVPWVRPPLPETALVLTALTLWAALPVAVWTGRERWRVWWSERRSLTGRLRLLSMAIIVVPLLLLGNLLPRQWSRQRELARLELARVVSEPLSSPGWERDLSWLVRDLGGAVTLYRGGEFAWSTRPDLAVRGQVPWLVPREAYVRAVRGWLEPIVQGEDEPRIYAPLSEGESPVVVGISDLRQLAVGGGLAPGEWFVVTGAVGLLLALVAAERLGLRLARPLRELVRAVRRLEHGDEVEPLEAPADEEVALLSRSFVTMARAVRGREADLRRERDLLGEVLGTLSAAVVVAGRHGGMIELANPAAHRLLGESYEIASLVKRFGAPFESLLAQASEGVRGSETLRSPGAPEALWRVTGVPLPGDEGRILLVMEDLSEVARAERLASLAELARIVAHEVKNPLTPIRLWAEEIQMALQRRRGDVTDIARIAAEQILERVSHLHEVAQGFSNLVALERWEPEPVTLSDLVSRVVAEYAVLGQRGIEVETVSAGDTTVMADPQWLRRALRHLLENSVRAIGEGGGRIRIEVAEERDEVSLTVSDTGGGVAEEHLGRLFEPQFSTTSEGSGLGLAVVHRVASRAGGGASARNAPEGLVVRLTFPGA